MLNPKEKEKLISDHIGLAKSLAKKHRQFETTDRPNYEEREAEAFLALAEAASHYNPDIGPFSTYATKVIKSQLIRADRKYLFPMRVSDNTHKILRDIRREVNNGVEETPEAVAAALKINIKKIEEVWKYYKKEVILQPKQTEEESESIAEKIPSRESVEDIVEIKIQKEKIAQALNQLDDIEKLIITHRFGFATGEAKLSNEIIEELNIKESQYKIKEATAIEKLKNILGDINPSR